MNNLKGYQYQLERFLNILWLRPENVVWDVMKADLIGKELLRSDNILEIGIGNGYFTFMAMGGEFKEEYDWYYNVNLEGFMDNKDIYDSANIKDIEYFIDRPTKKRLNVAIDNKANLLKQASQLNFIDQTIVLDANKEFTFDNIDTVYSNILYWLNNPFEVLKNIEKNIPGVSKLILVFPNSNFFKYCNSYKRDSKIETLLNRGRADSIMWNMDLPDFEKKLLQNTGFKIEESRKYLAKLTLQTWDIGLRPLSPHLIKMANSLSREKRLEIKQEWCETCLKYIRELFENELEKGEKEGGFNFVFLRKA